jgi:hypothetical protein
MDIKDVQSAKRQLENQISELLVKFSEDTGLSVNEIHIGKPARMSGKHCYIVTVEIKL